MADSLSVTVEEWRPVVGWEEWYEVSDIGHVRSWRKVRPYGSRLLEPKTLALTNNKSGYPTITVQDTFRRPQRTTKLVHRLVLESFVGPCPKGQQVCHQNGVRTDNRVENLRYDTPKNNTADKLIHGTHDRGERSVRHILKQEQVVEMRERYACGDVTLLELANDYGVAHGTVHGVVQGNRWAWLPC